MRPFFSHDVTEAMIYDDAVAESTLEWIRTYPQKAGYEQLQPSHHDRLRPGAACLSPPAVFTVTRLALCHLGNHCTCRKILAAVDLR